MSSDKKVFEEKMERDIKELDRNISRLSNKLEEMKEEKKPAYEKIMAELKEKRHALEVKSREVRETGDEAWSEMESGIKSAYQELKKASESALDKLQE